MNYQLLSAILKGVWAIDYETALAYSPLLKNIFGGSKVEFEFDSDLFTPTVIYAGTTNISKYTSYSDIPEGSLAIFSIAAPLMKNDQVCGPVGTATIGRMIIQADNSPNIDGIILKIDSPGGSVDGVIALAEIISNTKKPIIAFADGLMASAAYWISAHADEIIAADDRTRIGSIGVLHSFADMQPAYEKLGVKFHAIVADQSPDKIQLFNDLRAGKYETFKKEFLNPIAEDFILDMKSQRPLITDDQLTGKLYYASSVSGTMIDSIGNFDFAIKRLNELISNNRINHNNTTSMSKQFKTINALLAIEALVMNEEGVYLSEEQLDLIEAALLTPQVSDPPAADPPAADPPAQNANIQLIADLQTQVSDLTDQIASLNESPAPDSDPAKSGDSGAAVHDDHRKNVLVAKEALAQFEN